jgi:hypothetical protein
MYAVLRITIQFVRDCIVTSVVKLSSKLAGPWIPRSRRNDLAGTRETAQTCDLFPLLSRERELRGPQQLLWTGRVRWRALELVA